MASMPGIGAGDNLQPDEGNRGKSFKYHPPIEDEGYQRPMGPYISSFLGEIKIYRPYVGPRLGTRTVRIAEILPTLPDIQAEIILELPKIDDSPEVITPGSSTDIGPDFPEPLPAA